PSIPLPPAAPTRQGKVPRAWAAPRTPAARPSPRRVARRPPRAAARRAGPRAARPHRQRAGRTGRLRVGPTVRRHRQQAGRTGPPPAAPGPVAGDPESRCAMLIRRHQNGRRPGFTLLEVTLASAIGLLIMYGLYLAISVQLKFAEAGRYAVEQATLARSLTARIANDITPSIGMPDPSRFRQSNQSGQSGQAGAGGTTPTSGSTTPSSTTPSSTTPSSTTPSSTTPSGTTSTTTPADSNGVPIQALYGDASCLRVYVSRVPPGLGGGSSGGATGEVAVKSDQRVIEYWVTGNGGLARQEIAVVTASADNLPLARGTGNEGQY